MKTMLAAVLRGFNDLRLEQVPIPVPKTSGEVLVKVKSCGICATDVKAITGRRRNVKFPSIQGHEPAGVVAGTGPGILHVKEGDEVIVQPLGSCGFCRACRTGFTHHCASAFVIGGDGPENVWNGAFAEYVLTMESTLYPKPAAISWDAAAVTEPLAGAWKGVIAHSEMRVADDVVVIGVGSIGLLCLMVAKVAGAARLIAVDTSLHALEQALRLGATHAVNPADGDAKKRIYEILPDGPDLVVEAAGPIEAVRLMVDLRRRGTRWNVFGITTHETFELDGGLTHFLEGRQDASFGTTTVAMAKSIRLMETGLINTEAIISHRFPLAKIHEALAVMDTPDHNKIIIHP